MKWLLIVLLALTVLISGCNKTGYECPSCGGEVAKSAKTCPDCGQVFDFFKVYPRALDSDEEQRRQDAVDKMKPFIR